jgi:hypothetical protein
MERLERGPEIVAVLVRSHGTENNTGQTITGPLDLEIIDLPKSVHLLGKHGVTRTHGPKGSPFVKDNVTLGPGGFIGFLVQFSKPVGFGVRVLAGPGAV